MHSADALIQCHELQGRVESKRLGLTRNVQVESGQKLESGRLGLTRNKEGKWTCSAAEWLAHEITHQTLAAGQGKHAVIQLHVAVNCMT